ncbi:hypothetical protein D9M68_910260 [compost metagenome]
MQQVEVDALGIQPPQAARAGRRHTLAAGVVRIDLADQKHLLAHPGNRLAHHQLGAAFAVHLGRVDQAQAQLDTLAQRRHFRAPLAGHFAHAPGALTDQRHSHTSQFKPSHRLVLVQSTRQGSGSCSTCGSLWA